RVSGLCLNCTITRTVLLAAGEAATCALSRSSSGAILPACRPEPSSSVRYARLATCPALRLEANAKAHVARAFPHAALHNCLRFIWISPFLYFTTASRDACRLPASAIGKSLIRKTKQSLMGGLIGQPVPRLGHPGQAVTPRQ